MISAEDLYIQGVSDLVSCDLVFQTGDGRRAGFEARDASNRGFDRGKRQFGNGRSSAHGLVVLGGATTRSEREPLRDLPRGVLPRPVAVVAEGQDLPPTSMHTHRAVPC